uniref:Uncharacterized protein LOC105032703 isoform X3 n=1 Tax=Elaeis guineensis var. tenera TaxID=51953 RepID=A0A8N4EXV6_ELAGV|nr:uncharacterized protein LOC105032703 isoform X3 [Elaeis guineensis]
MVILERGFCYIVEWENGFHAVLDGLMATVKKHIKQGQGYEGGIFSIEAPLHVSNVQVLDPVTGRPCKIGYKYLEDGTKVRISRGQQASGALIPRPEILKQRRKPRPMEHASQSLSWFLLLIGVYTQSAGHEKGNPRLGRGQ